MTKKRKSAVKNSADQARDIAADTMIVGIGASAGGLEALQSFFKNMPVKTGLAFVVIQHLSPDYKSLMDELLARTTAIPIQVVSDGMSIEPDSIFLIPPRKNLSIFHGKLYLEDQGARKGLNLPVDIFFRSLAIEMGKSAIGIILSGTGSDGTLGTRAIKEAGGLIMVQNEESAKFDGMPRNSIATGLVDYVLSPDKMPQALVDYVKHPFVKDANRKEEIEALGDVDTLTKVILILRDFSGIDFSHYKENTIIRRLERRISINRYGSLEEYFRFLCESDKEKATLSKELLIGVTRFFRDADAFKELEQKVFPELAHKQKVRIWSAACSTGEEVYSLAIAIQAYIEDHGLDTEVKIFATDVDRDSIEQAGRGYYPDSVVADVDAKYLTKYFTRVESGYQINDSIRKNIVFATHNLLKDSPFSRLDLIVCRNFFIYLKPDVQSRLLSNFYYSLGPGGFLFMGSSETVGEMADGFECIDPRSKIYRGRSNYVAHPQVLSNPKTIARSSIFERGRNAEARHAETARLEKLLEGLVSAFLPPSVVIDSQENIVHIVNDVRRFVNLRPGRFSQNLLANMPRELSLFISTLLRKLKREGKNTAFESIINLKGFEGEKLSLEGRVFDIDRTTYYMFSFTTHKIDKGIKAGSNSEHSFDEHYAGKVSDLEKELQFTKESLQSTVEELETSNEELQSSNEELIASNEELQSTNEELQSVNEELYTVNSEYQVKIDELTRLNSDINNLLVNTEVGALYLDRNLCIRKLTPMVSRITNIIESDVGRPIEHITIMPVENNLLQNLQLVVENLQPIDEELSIGQETYLARVRPYRSGYNAIDGFLITFVDISSLKNMEKEVHHGRVHIEKILENSPVAMLMVASDGQIAYCNKTSEILFKIPREEILARGFASKKWEITDTKGELIGAESLPFAIIKNTRQPVYDFLHYITTESGERRLLCINGTPLLSTDNRFEGAVFAIRLIEEERAQ